MKDRWMNVGFEDEELKPYIEPEADLSDQARIRESYPRATVSVCLHSAPIHTLCVLYQTAKPLEV